LTHPSVKDKKSVLRIPKFLSIIAIASIFIAFEAISISDFLNLPETPFDYSVSLPSYFLTDAGGGLPTSVNGIENTPNNNPITDHGATLGRVLFYDKNLSINRTIACASCHKQAEGFSDSKALSLGFDGGTTRRHSMTLINTRYYQRGRFFWDERASTLEEQILQPFQDPIEMGLTEAQISERVAAQPYYGELFSNAFGDGNITNERVAMALAQFVRSIVSFQSKYDTGRAMVNAPGANFPNFTALENQGKQLFLRPLNNGGAGCFGCHTTEAFVSANPGPQNNGLDAVSTTDLGAGETFPQNALFAGRFKTSTLRNIALTAPYMHDGRFTTLEEVVEHYNSGIQNHPTLSAALANPDGTPVRLNLNETQKSTLVAFMKTLTDDSIATEAKWSNPFCETNLCLEGNVDSGVFESSNSITNISNADIAEGNYVHLISGKSILLNANFEIKAGSIFTAEIDGCN
jgi:cytochrome c peroxidase